MSTTITLLLILLFGTGFAAFAFPAPPSPASPGNSTLEYIDPTLPPLHITHNPKCSITILQHVIADTTGAPPVSVPYYPPADCPAPWSRVILELSGSASDIQKDRIAAIWLSGAELLRTSTPFALSSGVFWRVQKDVTHYTSLLRSPSPEDNSTDAEAAAAAPATFSMMLENSNATYPGVYTVNVSLHFYRGAVAQINSHPIIKGLYREPADLILPISNDVGECGPGYWFKLHNSSQILLTSLSIPNNTYRAVLELYVSHHDEDEYWYANPLRSTGETKIMSLSSSSSSSSSLFHSKANGAFRQVELTIDKLYAGGVVPFPVIYPGSINPFFWAPVAGIAAYDLPSYDLDLTPFVGLLVDGREHDFSLIIRDSQPFWLVSGNLHLWLDAWSDRVEGALVRHRVPPLRLSRQADWRGKDGKSSIDGQLIVRFSGWVSSSKGNVSTSIRQRLKFKSRVEMQGKGVVKQAAMEVKSRTDVRASLNRAVVGRASVSIEAPLLVTIERANGGGGTVLERTKIFHGMTEGRSVGGKGEMEFSELADRQDSEGSVLVGEDGMVWGSGDTSSMYKFRDEKACYLRTVKVVGGRMKEDVETASCAGVAEM
ncbi:peptide-N4-(N-acetyl-beta-glucosaminyl)asparagine amidase A-like [Phalaenopsis equestris]|uniref:peptide-N4-(N-acetyl-beta- glucosaminyl)asparagine amidase A-like n=1 Tax=Phalaenopsis equestris TaxID=78828 RepID=UPI0009E3CBCD|nr:peptide-N4-(N-acetyl-beta-glucosaminyl)asparagine amidase A-like [Phalaenopsis equestris]